MCQMLWMDKYLLALKECSKQNNHWHFPKWKSTTAERGQRVIVCSTIQTTGNYILPLFTFSCVGDEDYMMHGAPLGSVSETHTSGWINTENLHMKTFVNHFKW